MDSTPKRPPFSSADDAESSSDGIALTVQKALLQLIGFASRALALATVEPFWELEHGVLQWVCTAMDEDLSIYFLRLRNYLNQEPEMLSRIL